MVRLLSFPLLSILVCLCCLCFVRSVEEEHDDSGLVDPFHEILHMLNITEAEFNVEKLEEVVEHFSERFTCGNSVNTIVSRYYTY